MKDHRFFNGKGSRKNSRCTRQGLILAIAMFFALIACFSTHPLMAAPKVSSIHKGDTKIQGMYVMYEKPEPSNGFNILMIPGGLQGADVYHNFLPYFAKRGYNAYAMSLPGHPLSDVPKNYHERSIIDYAEDVHAVASKIGEPLIILGHSMGGRVALEYASKYETVATICIGPSAPKGCGVPSRTDLKVPTGGALVTPQWMTKKGFLGFMFAGMPGGLNEAASPEILEWSWKHVGNESPKAMYELCANLPLNNRTVSFPVAIFTGQYDAAHIKADKFVADYVGADYIVLFGAVHAAHLQKTWKKHADKIGVWLRSQALPWWEQY